MSIFTEHSQSTGPSQVLATHSSILAWKIPWTEKPGRLQSMGLQRVGHDWATSLSLSLHLLLGRKVMTNLDSILKSRDITLPTKVHLVKALVFPVVMYGCESGTIKKAECQRIDAFELWCWRRLLRVPWTARRSNQSVLKEISPGCSLEGLMLKLKLPIFWSPHAKSWLIEKDPDAGKDWRWEKKLTIDDEMVRWHHRLNGREFGWTPGVGDGQGSLMCCSQCGRRVGHNWVTELN